MDKIVIVQKWSKIKKIKNIYLWKCLMFIWLKIVPQTGALVKSFTKFISYVFPMMMTDDEMLNINPVKNKIHVIDLSCRALF